MKTFVTKVKSVPEGELVARPARETGPYVELMLDRNFKLFFGSEERLDLLLALLQEFLPELGIVGVELGDKENVSMRKELKNSVLFSAMGHPFQQFAEIMLRSSVTSGSSFVWRSTDLCFLS